MKQLSIIGGLVLSVLAGNAFAANPATFTATRDFTASICELNDAPGATNNAVGILMKGETDPSEAYAAKYVVTTNKPTITWDVTTTKVTGSPVLNANNQPMAAFIGVPATQAAVVVNKNTTSWDQAHKTENVTNHTFDINVEPAFPSTAPIDATGTVEIKGKVSVTCM